MIHRWFRLGDDRRYSDWPGMRHFRFSLRILLALTLAIALPLAWLASNWSAASRENSIISQLPTQLQVVEHTEYMTWECTTGFHVVVHREPSWILHVFASSYSGPMFSRITLLRVDNPRFSIEDLVTVAKLPSLKRVEFSYCFIEDEEIDKFKKANPRIELLFHDS